MTDSEENPKLKHSNYQLCIGTHITQPTKEQIKLFKQSLEEVFNEENLKILIQHKNDEYELNFDKIERVVVKHAIELAPEDNKLHSHTLVCITHRTRVKLDLKFIRDKIKELNKMDSETYLHSNVTGGAEKGAILSYLDYVFKEEKSEE